MRDRKKLVPCIRGTLFFTLNIVSGVTKLIMYAMSFYADKNWTNTFIFMPQLNLATLGPVLFICPGCSLLGRVCAYTSIGLSVCQLLEGIKKSLTGQFYRASPWHSETRKCEIPIVIISPGGKGGWSKKKQCNEDVQGRHGNVDPCTTIIKMKRKEINKKGLRVKKRKRKTQI